MITGKAGSLECIACRTLKPSPPKFPGSNKTRLNLPLDRNDSNSEKFFAGTMLASVWDFFRACFTLFKSSGFGSIYRIFKISVIVTNIYYMLVFLNHSHLSPENETYISQGVLVFKGYILYMISVTVDFYFR